MDNIEEIKVVATQRIHNIHCDRCGKLLFKSDEENFNNPYVYERVYFLKPGDYYSVTKDLCFECQDKTITEIKKFLSDLGFKKMEDRL